MQIVFVVNDPLKVVAEDTTVRLARSAGKRGHGVFLVGIADLSYHADGTVHGVAVQPREPAHESDESFLGDVQGSDAQRVQVCMSGVDAVFLRHDPAEEPMNRQWAPMSGLLFAELVAAAGVLVVNDPRHLTDAMNKTYFQQFPEEVRPRTCISRNAKEITDFIDAEGGTAVVKPLQGSGGQGVFLVNPHTRPNLNQVVEATTRDGYALVQEYLPEAREGDMRLILLNGEPLCVDGQYASVRRFAAGDDVRNNLSAGGSCEFEQPDEAALRLAEAVKPKLKTDGMFFVGLDIVRDKLMEINVNSPSGINQIEDLCGIDFSAVVIANLERKLEQRARYRKALPNAFLATL